MKTLLALLALLAATAFAADVSGNWKATAEGPQGAIERTFTFQQHGTELTGETTSEMMGKSTINEGKVEGENISFAITVNFQGEERKLTYHGKISGDTIKLTSDFGGGMSIEWTLKKSS
ncbi:MAG TPA: hypothetical protein VMA31_09365 [Bryobacteraceae bacterium]|nr:hypothetical protein [Bryobacteraceae bacterium]